MPKDGTDWDQEYGFTDNGRMPKPLTAALRQFDPPMSRVGHFRPIQPVLLAGSCLRRPESGPDAGMTSRSQLPRLHPVRINTAVASR
ncbi:hypothetical protein [Bradyrhizobium murdochi]|uniref:hypothetical protein n=1 Tax=Bradyrhizobium murdochi TaxID=1038859 RepID=UPI00040C88D0|nr:hypothetical protein [Bradyrhizobium murdochi]